MNESGLKIDAFVRFFKRHLDNLPMDYTDADQNKMTVLFLCLNGLDLISDIGEIIPEDTRKRYIDWIYSQQIVPGSDGDTSPIYGFRGGPALITLTEGKSKNHSTNKYDISHVTMTYAALCSLLILRDDLSRVDRGAIISTIKGLRSEEGCIYSDAFKSEYDIRFAYSACAVSHILNDWSGINAREITEFVNKCKSYEGGFGLYPGCEAHGGSTYCALSTLSLLGEQLPEGYSSSTYQWLINRHVSGFQGRPNKEPDMCYSYWIGSSLKILNPDIKIDTGKLMEYANKSYNCLGGFGKIIGALPDVLHTSLGLQGLSITNAKKLNFSVADPRIGLTDRTMNFLQTSTIFWKQNDKKFGQRISGRCCFSWLKTIRK